MEQLQSVSCDFVGDHERRHNRFLLFTYNSIEAVDPMNRPVTVDIINTFLYNLKNEIQ
jgi:hypothetical protein